MRGFGVDDRARAAMARAGVEGRAVGGPASRGFSPVMVRVRVARRGGQSYVAWGPSGLWMGWNVHLGCVMSASRGGEGQAGSAGRLQGPWEVALQLVCVTVEDGSSVPQDYAKRFQAERLVPRSYFGQTGA